MPWREQTTMSQRFEYVQLASQEGANLSELCRRFDISRPTGYKWLERHMQGELLMDRPKRPHSCPNQTEPPIEARVIAVRFEHPTWGGRKIAAYLQRKGLQDIPHPSTITGILRRNGFIDPKESLKRQAYQRFEMDEPNQLWQMDFKGHFQLSSGGRCHPLTVLDDHSRFLVGLKACSNEKSQTVQEQLTSVFRIYGLPQRMLMDNGSPWGDDAESRHTIFTAWLIRLGIQVSHGRPYHPQTQGKDERLHRTFQEDLLERVTLSDLETCRNAFDQWRHCYNFERPHESLQMQTPSNRYRMSLKPFPEQLPLIVYNSDWVIRKVDSYGKISFRNRSFRIGRAFGNYPVGLKPTDLDGVYDVYFCDQMVASIGFD
jgi:transposase InsO family protein